ncbi:MAG TPA: hypothetical protein VLS89_18795, partial [Candidatus Nanopelagicales bacterium]|nr:hypothetical protein [Candidatus Nanopelagicales bacterium]
MSPPRPLLALAAAAVLGAAAWGISALLFAPTLPVGTPAFSGGAPAAPAPAALTIEGTLAPYRLTLPSPAWKRTPIPPAEGVVHDLHLTHADGGAMMDVYLHRLPNEFLAAEDLANHLLETIRSNAPPDFTEVRREPIPDRPGGLLLHTRHRGSAGPVDELHAIFAQQDLGYHLDAMVDP